MADTTVAAVPTAEEMEAASMARSVAQVANVSRLLREAIHAAIPVSPEQYMTISIPGEVIDTRDVTEGGTFVYAQRANAFTPSQVRQAEGRLVDKMMPLASVMLGNTGKSVSRSYSRAIDCMVARKATIRGGDKQIRSPGEKGYDTAMEYLTKADPGSSKTPVDTYVEKQHLWATAQDEWDEAKVKAREDAKKDHPNDIVAQRQAYDDWNQSHYRKFKFAVQGRYMDWVANGHKYEVEYNFGVVDVDGIMARIEKSKESIRNSTMVDYDGANEIVGVTLSPRNWAELCRQKVQGWFRRNGDYSIGQLKSEIERLNRLLLSYEVLQDSTVKEGGGNPTFPISSPEGPVTPARTSSDADAILKQAFKELYDAEAALAKQDEVAKANAGGDAAKYKAEKEKEPYKAAAQNVAVKQKALSAEVEKNKRFYSEYSKWQIASLNDAKIKGTLKSWLEKTIASIKKQILALEAKRDEKMKELPPAVAAIEGAHDNDKGSGTDMATASSNVANPMFGINEDGTSASGGAAGGAGTDGSTPATGGATGSSGGTTTVPSSSSSANPWTTISASFSAQDQQSTSTQSSWGFSAGGSAGWGLWSAGGSYSHGSSQGSLAADMASCDVSVTFDVMVVNIDRPWLYAELFNDFELDVAEGILISPGAAKLKELMMQQKGSGVGAGALDGSASAIRQLAQYHNFPAFPTSFLVAADTVVEFSGETQHIESSFNDMATSGGVNVGWGPFKAESKYHNQSSSRTYQVQSTATGCRISFGAPQIVGWVSQIVPQLPRGNLYEPMVQNNVE